MQDRAGRHGMRRCCALIALTLFTAHLHSEQSRFLCEEEELLVFGCSLGDKQVSVCASPDLTIDTGYVQYRLGTPERLEQVYPDGRLPPQGRFFLSIAPYAGGGASAIRFHIDGSDHFLFEQTVRTNFAPGEPHHPEFSAGLAIRDNEKGTTTVTKPCEDNAASIRRIAYDSFPREEYHLETIP